MPKTIDPVMRTVINSDLWRIRELNEKIKKLEDERDSKLNPLYKEFGKEKIDKFYNELPT